VSKTKDIARGLTAMDCVAALRTRFGPPECAFLEQVGNGTGWRQRRWADAVAVNLWPSRGLTINGFEVKVSLQDWKKELKSPEKSAEVQKYCDHWWIVAPRGLVPSADLPSTWGLIEVNEQMKLHTLVTAPKLEPVPLDRHFMAAVLRRHTEGFEVILNREKTRSREEGMAQGPDDTWVRLKRAEETQVQLSDRIRAFEAASGVTLMWGDAPQIGEAVKLILNGNHRHSVLDALKRDEEAYVRRIEMLRADIKTLESVRRDE
jgi:hypothetical protein